MDYGKLAIARALTDQSVGAFLDRDVRPDMMPTPEDGAVLKFILDFFRQHQAVPAPRTVETQFPGYALGYAPDPATAYVDAIVKQHVRVRAQEEILHDVKLFQHGDPLQVAAGLQTKLARLSSLTEGNRVKLYNEHASGRFARYLNRKNRVGLLGIPTPWSSLDDLTQGWLPEMYVGVAARPKTGKTFWMLRVALAAWQAGYKVLFVNKELPDEMMENRSDAIGAKLPYEKLRTGALTMFEEQRLEQYLKDLEANPPSDWWWLHDVSNVSAIRAKVEEYKPDIVFIDGAYLLEDEMGGRTEREQQKNLSRNIKRLAQKTKLPVIISIQLNRDGDQKKSKTQLTMSNVYGSDAFAQDVDLLIGLEQSDDQRMNRQLQITPLAVREAEGKPIIVGWDFDTMESPDYGYPSSVAGMANDKDDDDVLTFKD